MANHAKQLVTILMSSLFVGNLPLSWSYVALDHISFIIQGQSPPGETYNWHRVGLPFLQGKAEFGEVSPVAVKWCSAPTKIAEPGDVLVSIRAPVGPTNVCDTRSCIGRGLAALRPQGDMPTKFLLYGLRASEDEFRSKATGTTFEAVRGADLRSHSIPLPPLPEQHRIVAEIEKHFTRLDASIAVLKRTQINLKRYRASLLKAACEGRLVPTEAELARAEDRDYEPADHLLERILAERRAHWESQPKRRGKYKEPAPPDTSDLRELPEGWVWTSVENLLVEPLSNGRSVKTAPQGFPVLRLTSLRGDDIDQSEQKVGAWTAKEAEEFLIQEGDFFVSRGNGSIKRVGIGALVGPVSTPVAFPDTLIRFRLHRGMTKTLFAHIWNSSLVRRQLEPRARTTAGIYKLNQQDLLPCMVPLPPLAEQHRIVAEVSRRMSVIQQAEATVDASLNRADRLRQSILKQAFSGQLVPQDPNDEPASVLLERIRTEREGVPN